MSATVEAGGLPSFATEYAHRRSQWSDIVDHLPRLYAEATRHPDMRVIELGTRAGNSTAAFLAAVEAVGGHVWSVDVAAPVVPQWWFESPLWTTLIGDDLVVAGQLPDGVDVIFIDTTHTYAHTLAELRTYFPKLNPSGVVLCHDTELEQPELALGEEPFPVRRAIDDFRREVDVECQYVNGCYGLAVLRRRGADTARVGVTVTMVAFENEPSAVLRLARDLTPALRLYERWIDAELVVVDNSREPQLGLAQALADVPLANKTYVWNDGRNLYYGPALNTAVEHATRPLLVYACANHGQSHDPTWLGDLIRPLVSDPHGEIGMTGTLQPTGDPSQLGFSDQLAWVHIQGGLFAAAVDVLRRHPYPDGPIAHWGSDIYQSLRLADNGFRLVDVPTVKSVWRARVPPGPWKYVHDES